MDFMKFESECFSFQDHPVCSKIILSSDDLVKGKHLHFLKQINFSQNNFIWCYMCNVQRCFAVIKRYKLHVYIHLFVKNHPYINES